MDEAAFMLESSDEAIARIATRVGYETTMAFSKVFHQHYGFSPGRYRALKGAGGALEGVERLPTLEPARRLSVRLGSAPKTVNCAAEQWRAADRPAIVYTGSGASGRNDSY